MLQFKYFIDYRLPTTDYRLPTIDYRPQDAVSAPRVPRREGPRRRPGSSSRCGCCPAPAGTLIGGGGAADGLHDASSQDKEVRGKGVEEIRDRDAHVQRGVAHGAQRGAISFPEGPGQIARMQSLLLARDPLGQTR